MATILSPIVFAGLLLAGAEDTGGYVGIQIKKDIDVEGIIVVAIVGDGPADKAGLKKDDIILKLNGDKVGVLQQFVEKIRESKPGDEVKLLIMRDGKEKEIKVKVGKMPDPDGA